MAPILCAIVLARPGKHQSDFCLHKAGCHGRYSIDFDDATELDVINIIPEQQNAGLIAVDNTDRSRSIDLGLSLFLKKP